MIALLLAAAAWAGPLWVQTVVLQTAVLQTPSAEPGSAAASGCAFNEGRPYLLSVNDPLYRGPLARQLRRGLSRSAHADQLVVDRFGSSAPPTRVELVLGRDLPVELARDLLSIVQAAELPVVVRSRAEQVGPTCVRSQAVLGGVWPTTHAPLQPERLAELLDPGLDEQAFWARIPTSDR
jgi:hypothetical protein